MSRLFETVSLRAFAGLALLMVWFGMETGWGVLGLILFAAGLHELGHYLVLRALGGSVVSLRVTPLGATLQADCRKLSYSRELIAVLAGPTVNIAAGLGLAVLAEKQSREALYAAAGAHFISGVFNLLPIRSLDGGRALELLLHWRRGPQAGETLLAALGALSALSMGALLAAVILGSGGSLWLLPPAVALLGTALSEMGALFAYRGKSGRKPGKKR